MRRNVAGRALAATAVLPLLALGACGSSDLKAGDKLTSDQIAKTFNGAFTGITAEHVELSADLPGATFTGSGDNVIGPPFKGKYVVKINGQSVTYIVIDKVGYMLPPGTSGKYVRGSLTSLGMGSLVNNFDPSTWKSQYADQIQSAVYAGTEKVGDVDTKHYTVRLKVTGASASGSAVPSAQASLAANGVPAEMWFDSDGHLRKMELNYGTTKLHWTYSKLGQNITIDAPPDSQLLNLPKQ